MIVEPARRDEFLALMQETYGQTMTPAEFDWWFDRNPAGPRILNAARGGGEALGALSMHFVQMDNGLNAFAVHAVTTPASRGRGVFSTLELHNEAEAAAAGAGWALGFTNPLAGPILVGKLGWEDVTSLRIWVRPRRWPKRVGRLRREGVAPFDAVPAVGEAHQLVRDRRYLDWRYVDSPRPYARVGEVVVTHAVWHGFSSAVVCEHGHGLRRALKLVDADLAVAMVNPGEERRFLLAGFVPTPRTIRFIGKRLHDDAPALPKRRDAWYFTLGDLDFF